MKSYLTAPNEIQIISLRRKGLKKKKQFLLWKKMTFSVTLVNLNWENTLNQI